MSTDPRAFCDHIRSFHTLAPLSNRHPRTHVRFTPKAGGPSIQRGSLGSMDPRIKSWGVRFLSVAWLVTPTGARDRAASDRTGHEIAGRILAIKGMRMNFDENQMSSRPLSRDDNGVN